MVLVAFYNLSMDKLSKDQIIYDKANKYIQDRMPEFAQRFFKAKKNVLKPNSYLAYAIEVAYFFDYLKDRKLFDLSMKMSDLSRITAEIIEDYVEDTRYITAGDVKKQISDRTEHRKICALSSFFDYYSKNDFILYNPVKKVNRPIIPNGAGKGSDMIHNLSFLDFVINGSLPNKASDYQKKLRLRDTAMIALMMSTGLRSSECVGMNIDDLDLEHNKITIRSRKAPNEVYISPLLSEILGSYLASRLEMITEYGHDNALFLSLQMKRLTVRALQDLMKKYTTFLFGKGNNITPRDLKNAFRFNSFEEIQNIYVTADVNGMSSNSIYRYYLPYIEQFESSKGKLFDSGNILHIERGKNEV